MVRIRLGFFALLLMAQTSYAVQDAPQTFTLDGRAYSNAAATAPMVDSISAQIQILNATQDCILYEETQTIDTTASSGYFTVQIGSATSAAKRSAGDSNNSMSSVFSNTLTTINGKFVSSGAACIYNLLSGDKRYVRLQMTPAADHIARVITPLWQYRPCCRARCERHSLSVQAL